MAFLTNYTEISLALEDEKPSPPPPPLPPRRARVSGSSPTTTTTLHKSSPQANLVLCHGTVQLPHHASTSLLSALYHCGCIVAARHTKRPKALKSPSRKMTRIASWVVSHGHETGEHGLDLCIMCCAWHHIIQHDRTTIVSQIRLPICRQARILVDNRACHFPSLQELSNTNSASASRTVEKK